MDLLETDMEWLCDEGEEIQICIEIMKDLEFKLMLATQRPDRPYEILALISRFNHLHSRLGLFVSNDESEVNQIKLFSERVLFYLKILDSVRKGKTDLESVMKPEYLWSEEVALMFSEVDQMEDDTCDIYCITDQRAIEEMELDNCLNFSSQTLQFEDINGPPIPTFYNSQFVTQPKPETYDTIDDIKPVFFSFNINFHHICVPLMTRFFKAKQVSTVIEYGSVIHKIVLLDTLIDEFITEIGEFGVLRLNTLNLANTKTIYFLLSIIFEV